MMPGQPKLPWEAEELETVKTLIDDGKTIPEIARLVGRSQEATRARAAKNGWYAYPSRLFKGEVRSKPSLPVKHMVLYVSRCVLPPADIETRVADLVTAARQKNDKLGITGALLCTGTDFAQYIEGDRSAVESLMAQISVDDRHEKIIILKTGKAANSQFEGWGLAYCGVSPLVSAIIDRARRSRAGDVERGSRNLVTFLKRFAARPNLEPAQVVQLSASGA